MAAHILVPNKTPDQLERSITHFDLDRELWEQQHKIFIVDPSNSRKVIAVKAAPKARSWAGGSPSARDRCRRYMNITGTAQETLYSNALVGTAKASFTTEFAINDTAGMGAQPVIQPGFWNTQGPGSPRGRGIRVISRGVAGVTGTPTWLWTYRLNAVVTPANPPTGPIVAGQPGAVTALNGVSAQFWEACFDLQLTLDGAPGGNSTFRGLGIVNAPGLFTPTANSALFGGAASPGTIATVDISLLNTLTVGITSSSSSASNTIQLLQLLIISLG